YKQFKQDEPAMHKTFERMSEAGVLRQKLAILQAFTTYGEKAKIASEIFWSCLRRAFPELTQGQFVGLREGWKVVMAVKPKEEPKKEAKTSVLGVPVPDIGTSFFSPN
ncbi:MAG: hypothetical protein NT094_03885, partial [Candidatus Staskawiczbacteria bacterium]|nr:hypothetical protein [Candidatus Staskawiczbacteria bacterium]